VWADDQWHHTCRVSRTRDRGDVTFLDSVAGDELIDWDGPRSIFELGRDYPGLIP